MSRTRTSRRDGFTLVELAVSAGLLIVISAVAVAGHRQTQPRYNLERAVARLATDLSGARMRAISECLPVTVTFSSTNGSYVVWADSNTNGIMEVDERTVEALDDNINLVMGGSCTQGVFSARGSFEASVPFWLIKMDAGCANDKRLIYVLPSGQVRCTTHELTTQVCMAYGL